MASLGDCGFKVGVKVLVLNNTVGACRPGATFVWAAATLEIRFESQIVGSTEVLVAVS